VPRHLHHRCTRRDTHVVIGNFVNGATFQGKRLSYNNASLVFGTWQLEPSLKLYRQSDNTGATRSRWAPGLRLNWRVVPQAALESEVNVEKSKTSGPQRIGSSRRSCFLRRRLRRLPVPGPGGAFARQFDFDQQP